MLMLQYYIKKLIIPFITEVSRVDSCDNCGRSRQYAADVQVPGCDSVITAVYFAHIS